MPYLKEEMSNGDIIPLQCSLKNYEWGKIGKESLVGRLGSANHNQNIINDIPFAEVKIFI